MAITLTPIDDSTWNAYQGAVSWPDGSRPLFAEGVFANGMEWHLVFCAEGSGFFPNDEDLEFGGYMLDRVFQSPGEASAWVAEHLPWEHPTRLDFFLAGFKPCQ